ncbi:hypothetical protein Ahy_B09g095299 [Arachis hypogaea]|uniref:PB1 domain-containing protein n=1 Tax=Arachis hypogaea TaxID=3818 RepID=A0A444XDS4_ARAHY|nr:hypothetical protein Ahy_B09g095299 [Arachis hypogaea]
MKTEMSFLCSYGGQIKFYDRNNQYLYERGNNKKLHVRSSINFNDMIAELSAISGTADMAYFKYQIPGYGLETLLSITNDTDLLNLMRDFDPNTPTMSSISSSSPRKILHPLLLLSKSLRTCPR